MDYHPYKAAVNRFFSRHVGGDRRPTFFDIDTAYPALNAITRHYPAIRAEFETVLRRGVPLPAYHELDSGQKAISAVVNPDKKWNVFMLKVFGYEPAQARALCPETCRALDGIPNMLEAFFSILEPGKSVPLHEGPYLGYLRYHLGLRVPKDDPPKIIVNGQPHTWKEGEAVLFDDSWPHEVVNRSNELRAVLIVDVLRPMPWLPTLVNKIVTHGVARPLYGRKVAQRAEAMTPVIN
ncbi:MAG: aspartyl/asparaginyl beta-hydroxylase domain-containing protein [Gammaproteobacteria bacterium]|nr:MAG: aspartyl/asparaginyl beta-hydroxylase domain-containing protein [Gammaproteobacteria bacterium]